MKKVLFATTALVMTAGVAAAEVAVTGTGRMGAIYDGNDVQFSSRIRAIFTMTGESDAGLSFGGTIRADNSASGNNGTAGEVWVSGTYGKLSMGDVVSASEAAIGDLPSIGYTDTGFAGDIEEISYLTGDGNNLDQGPNFLYQYSINDFSFYASASDGSDRAWFTTVGANDNVECVYDTDGQLIDCEVVSDDDLAWSVGAKYEADTYWAGLGYADQGDASEIVLGGGATWNNFTFNAIYADYSDRDTISFGGDDATGNFIDELTLTSDNYELNKTWGLGAEWKQDAIRVAAFYRRDELRTTDAGDALDLDDRNMDSFGVGADYDLGGGATASGGIVDSDWLNDTVVDMGVKFKF